MWPPRCGPSAGWCRQGTSGCGHTVSTTATHGPASSCGWSSWAVSQVQVGWGLGEGGPGGSRGMADALTHLPTTVSPPVPPCPEAGHRCASGDCALRGVPCDGAADCEDGSDEEGCGPLPVGAGRYHVSGLDFQGQPCTTFIPRGPWTLHARSCIWAPRGPSPHRSQMLCLSQSGPQWFSKCDLGPAAPETC